MAPGPGFTLPELLIALTIFIIVIAGVIFANLFGLKMLQLNATKLNATAWSRITFEKITDEIRASRSLYVGNMSNSVFVGLLDGEVQQGTSLLLYPTTNTTSFILYYLDSTDQSFRRATEQTNSAEILADTVTNNIVFTAQDLWGNVLTNKQNNQMIHLSLEFYQPKRFMEGEDYYKLETTVARRAVQ